MKFPVILCFLVLSAVAGAAESREALWRKVQAAMAQGLPKSAVEAIEPIIEGAIRDQAWAEATKAIGRRIALESQVEGGSPGAAIQRLSRQLERVPPTLRPVFHTLLANAYWGYFQQNRWRFAGRTASAAPLGDDFTTWDLRSLFAEIDRHFRAALAEETALQAIPIADFDALLDKGTVPDTLRPTLYDFLAHEALEFYEAGEQGLARPEDAFVAGADGPILASAEVFLRWQPQTSATEESAPTVRAIRLYQSLLKRHADQPDPAAFLDTDIDRLRFAHRVATGPDKDRRWIAALLEIADRWPRHELSARARQAAARIYQRENKLTEAHRLARQAAEAFPDSLWTRDSRNLIAELEAPFVSIATERAWNPPWPAIDITHRNTEKIWFRAIPVDWSQFLDRRLPRPERLNRKQRLEFLGRPSALEWSVDLPATPDYRTQLQSVRAPTTLPPGFYFVFASHRPGFAEADNELSVATVWVSELALVTINANAGLEGFVLDANTGEPRPGATIEGWYLAPNGSRTAIPAQTTDALGFFRLNLTQPGRGHLLRASLGSQQIALASDLWWMPVVHADAVAERDQTVLLTDRALYRPGQMIRFKGISYSVDNVRGRHQLRAGQEVTLVLRDANHQEVARRTLRTSDLGSFSGSFDAPRDRLPGRMSLEVEGDSGHTAWFSVEEYKRPKFQVVLDPPKDAPKLDDTTTWTGRAIAYTGNPIQGAKITWRVRRQTRFPLGWQFFRPGPGADPDADQEIAHGSAESAADGSFSFRFRALADPAALESDEPVFQFEIHADATDTTGETRSVDRSVSIGYAALAARIETSDWQESGRPILLRILTRSLEGESLAASGTLRVHRLEQPTIVHRASLVGPRPYGGRFGAPEPEAPPVPDLSNPAHWRLGDSVVEQTFRTPDTGLVTNRVELPAGVYRVVVESADRFGKKVTARRQITVLDPDARKLDFKVPYLLEARSWELEPGEEFLGVWGTGYDSGRAFVEVRHRDLAVQRFWTEPGRTQQPFRLPITEEHRGGFTVHVTQVRENRAYHTQRHVDVPWNDKRLVPRWESFRSQLEPGRKETWTAVVEARRPGTREAESNARSAMEMAAVLYDASLDQFLEHRWPESFDFWPKYDDYPRERHFSNDLAPFDVFQAREPKKREDATLRYRSFPADLRFERMGRVMMRARTLSAAVAPMASAELAAAPAAFAGLAVADAAGGAANSLGSATPPAAAAPAPAPASAVSAVVPRRNLSETAFFFPHLASDSNGTIRITFTAPEALTEWRFFGFAHDRLLRSGFLDGRTVTSKEVMVQPNPPRFLREGDALEFPVKVVNASNQRQSGKVRLTFVFALDDRPADAALGNASIEQDFDLPARESRTFTWPIRVPDGCGFLTFKTTAAAERHSDGEEGALPVLARRVLVTESKPLPVRGPGTYDFEFPALRDAGKSPTLRHQSLQVQMASHPAWYAVLALPYLMEYPHECSEQVFNRYYANQLARHVADSDPRIRRVFDQWRATPALDSPLQKNPDLVAVAIAETPWVRDAASESEARRNIGILFDAHRLDAESARASNKLRELMLADGGWPWFPGGPRNEFISLYLVSGFGRLRDLGIEVPLDLPLRALARLDAWMQERHHDLAERKLLDRRNIDASLCLYFYARSFFQADAPWPEDSLEARDYWLGQAREHWLALDRQSQAHIALGLARLGNDVHHDATGTAQAIVRSLEERSVVSPELGRYWNDDGPGVFWYRAPIETQALMIEAFQRISRNTAAAEECRTWLLQQKHTQHWPSTKATADAVHAILLGGPSLLHGTALVEVRLGAKNVTPDPHAGTPDPRSPPEPGTGFYQVRIPPQEIVPDLARIAVRKTDDGIAWGAVHWQYFEDLARIRPFAGTPLRLVKRLFTRTQTPQGAQLHPVTQPVRVGDELVVRLELRTDRDLEFVHLKDLRGSGTEPVDVLSGYRFQDGLGYYQSTRDTATHFFVDYLPKGTYVFEYALRVQHRGTYPTGVAEIQCLYAPEFGGHSESLELSVR